LLEIDSKKKVQFPQVQHGVDTYDGWLMLVDAMLKRQLLEKDGVIESLAAPRPLDNDVLLDTTFAFIGTNEFLYVGGVCRRWKDRYVSMRCTARSGPDVPATKTARSTTFATVARFAVALDCGLRIRSEEAEHSGEEPYILFDDLKLSTDPLGILTLARERGAAWHSNLSADAACYADIELLKWIYKSGCPWPTNDIFLRVISTASVTSCSAEQRLATLRWLQQLPQSFLSWSQPMKNVLLFEAGLLSRLKIAEFLLDEGAEWPKSCRGWQWGPVWPVSTVQWALSEGYSWQGWRCQEVREIDDAAAEALFKWAHSSGVKCPCTCSDPEPARLS
jgi:hypothetical protein